MWSAFCQGGRNDHRRTRDDRRPGRDNRDRRRLLRLLAGADTDTILDAVHAKWPLRGNRELASLTLPSADPGFHHYMRGYSRANESSLGGNFTWAEVIDDALSCISSRGIRSIRIYGCPPENLTLGPVVWDWTR